MRFGERSKLENYRFYVPGSKQENSLGKGGENGDKGKFLNLFFLDSRKI